MFPIRAFLSGKTPSCLGLARTTNIKYRIRRSRVIFSSSIPQTMGAAPYSAAGGMWRRRRRHSISPCTLGEQNPTSMPGPGVCGGVRTCGYAMVGSKNLPVSRPEQSTGEPKRDYMRSRGPGSVLCMCVCVFVFQV